ncbi:unnamed protein product [Prorocentrum cordatum]|uniref:Uncharacterized protein n=1 Tax=Prorocentrum cordatum TaxID=2364126 RepID=A0ABN9W4D3_9DINO|nr:unnamed protein product [Polarella glacialis]
MQHLVQVARSLGHKFEQAGSTAFEDKKLVSLEEVTQVPTVQGQAFLRAIERALASHRGLHGDGDYQQDEFGCCFALRYSSALFAEKAKEKDRKEAAVQEYDARPATLCQLRGEESGTLARRHHRQGRSPADLLRAAELLAEFDGEVDFLHAAAAEPAPGTGGFSPPMSQSQGSGEFGKLHDAEVRGPAVSAAGNMQMPVAEADVGVGEAQAAAADGGPLLATAAALAAVAAAAASCSRPSPARPAEVLRRAPQRRVQEQSRRREASVAADAARPAGVRVVYGHLMRGSRVEGNGSEPPLDPFAPLAPPKESTRLCWATALRARLGHGAEEQALAAAPAPSQRQPAAAPPPPPAAGDGGQAAAPPRAAAPRRLVAAAPRAEAEEPRQARPGLEGVLGARGFPVAAAARGRERAAGSAAARARRAAGLAVR